MPQTVIPFTTNIKSFFIAVVVVVTMKRLFFVLLGLPYWWKRNPTLKAEPEPELGIGSRLLGLSESKGQIARYSAWAERIAKSMVLRRKNRPDDIETGLLEPSRTRNLFGSGTHPIYLPQYHQTKFDHRSN